MFPFFWSLVNIKNLLYDLKILKPKKLPAKVISIGEQVPIVKVGDTIRYDKHAGHGIDFDGKLYYVIKAVDVVIIE